MLKCRVACPAARWDRFFFRCREMVEDDRLMLVRSPRWQAVRHAHLKLFPTCAACGGSSELEVHHIKPYHVCPELELDPANLITLCESRKCHFIYGHLYSWSSWNETVVHDAAIMLWKIRNRPITRTGV